MKAPLWWLWSTFLIGMLAQCIGGWLVVLRLIGWLKFTVDALREKRVRMKDQNRGIP